MHHLPADHRCKKVYTDPGAVMSAGTSFPGARGSGGAHVDYGVRGHSGKGRTEND